MIKKVVRVLAKEGPIGFWRRLRIRVLAYLRPASVMSAYGVRLTGNWNDATFRHCVQGAYGFYFSDFLRGLDTPFIFIDIGANQGLFSIIAAENRKCMQVYCFEPNDEIAAIIRSNLTLNKSRNVTIKEVAISDSDVPSQLVMDPDHSGVATLRETDEGKDSQHVKEVACINHIGLQEILGAHDHRMVVKIDVEGLEETVMTELSLCPFFTHVTDVFYEVDERWVDPTRIRKLLSDHGIDAFETVGSGQHYDVHATRSA